MPITRFQALQSVQYALDGLHLSPDGLEIDIIGGAVYVKGRLSRKDGREVTAEDVEALERNLRATDGIDDIVLELARWQKNQGLWQLRPSVIADETALEGFVQAQIPTIFKLQILLFFNKNPGTVDNVGGIAMRLGVGPAPTHKALDELVDAGWLKKVGSTVTAYRYNPDPQKREMMRIIQEMHDRSPGGRSRLFKMITRTGAPLE